MAKHPTTEDAPITDDAPRPGAGKGVPTPTRRERELANKRPLVVADRKVAARDAREKAAEARNRARIGMAAGEDKYLPIRDKGPQRKYIRDYIDARFNVGEFLIPVMFIVLILSIFPQYAVQLASIVALWVFFVVAVLDCVIVGFILKRKLGAKFGESKVERGYRWYAAMRALQLRLMRLPKPQVKRGKFPS